MSSTIVRTNKEGRMIVSKELLDLVGVFEGDSLEVTTIEDKLVLSKYKDHCIFCGDEKDLLYFKEAKICRSCIKSVNDMF